ncbi:MAG TPA: SRPBCC family protein [Solirubrobacteraceae bacterium]|jgi:carbon monoxide dehydrogenase subunit G|nr:SRPBCC family protein [Solirubrobacteraceae bacterium]
MPTARRTRTIAAPADELWATIRDPHHLPRWWPRVNRVEDVTDTEFTEVLITSAGKYVRADFTLAVCDERERRLCWEQRLEGSPFARLLRSAETEVRLTDPAGESGARAATEVTIELRQALHGFFARFGAFMVRRAATKTIDEALDGLERIGGS